ncbi:cAMP-dependent protein kinase type II regulatory subunit [Halotydeus destructor]|nr:cAMP-dependent protein kinase type II regulatory subunit [Halotydeus destructor]
MNRNRLEVPPELTNLLLDFTVSVLVNKPSDLIEYAVNYFNRKRDDRQAIRSGSVESNHMDDDEEEDSFEPDFAPPVKSLSFNRRKSVFAEQYDPEEEDDDEKIVYPKSDEQRKRLGEAVKNILLFRALDQQEMSEVLDAMFERKVKSGDLVIRQGDDGDYFYVIEKGTYRFSVTGDDGIEKTVGEYKDVGSFGELALMYNMPRSATAVAAADGSLWAMSRQTFRKIVLQRAYKKRKAYETLLGKVDMLASLETYERMNLCDALTPKKYSNGDLIIKEGDAADGMYFIEEGTVRVTKGNEENGGQERELSRLSNGAYFGELALITHKPRAANVYAAGDVNVAFLDVHAFERLLGPCMDIMKRNFNHYEEQLTKIFGSVNVSDLR